MYLKKMFEVLCRLHYHASQNQLLAILGVALPTSKSANGILSYLGRV